MWKLMVLGFVVQLVLLTTILDLNVLDDGEGVRFTDKRPCARNLMIVVIEGLQYEDILNANRSRAVRHLVPESVTFHVNVSSPYNDSIFQSEASIFDDKRVLYVGPSATPYHFNTSLWDLVLIRGEKDDLGNQTALNQQIANSGPEYGSYMVNRRVVIDHMRKIIESEQLDFYPLKFINIGRSNAMDDPLTPAERVWYFTKTFELMRNTTRSPSFIFLVASSMSLLVRNSTQDHNQDCMVIHGHSECIHDEETAPFFNLTLDYDQAYNVIEGYVSLTSIKREVPGNIESLSRYIVEGNLLEYIAGRVVQLQRVYLNFGLYISSWETLNTIFRSMDVIETETSPVVIAFTVFIFLMWISFLTVKTMKMVLDSVPAESEVNSVLLKYVNVLSLILLLICCIVTKLDGCPYRYAIYFAVGVLVFRLLCGEFLSSTTLQTECSLLDKVKIGIQLCILAIVVECLFWSIRYKKIVMIVFVMAAFGRIIQGAFAVTSYVTIISFSLATFCIGLQYLWSFSLFGGLVNVNVAAAVWSVIGVVAMKFLITKSNHDRFLTFLCILEVLLATSFTNVVLLYGFSLHSIVPVIGFFIGFSFLLPLFGGPDPKYRLIELAVSTAAVFMFFTCNGEALFLLSSFTVSFCSYLVDRDTQKKLFDDDSFYLNIFPATFHAVLLILACHVVIPGGGETLLRAYSTLTPDAPYHLIATGLFYFFKLGFLVNLLEATFLSSGPRLVTVPNLFIVVIILNLTSLRAFIQYSMFSSHYGKAAVYLSHILLHAVAALTFFLYPFVQILCNTCLFSICRKPQTTYIPQEPVN